MSENPILKGGITNTVTTEWVNTPDYTGHVVVKQYGNDELIGIPSSIRFRREVLALKYLERSNPGIAPRLIGDDREILSIRIEKLPNGFVLDEHLPYASDESRASIFHQAGMLLKQIHTPVNSSPVDYLESYLSKTQHAINKALPILNHINIDGSRISQALTSLIDPDEVKRVGVTRVHRDIWMNNFLSDEKQITGVIDWEHAGIGSPYEDFAGVNLWVERKYEDAHSFWNGYGSEPQHATLNGYLLGKCVELLATGQLSQYQQQETMGGGYLTAKIDIIKELLKYTKPL